MADNIRIFKIAITGGPCAGKSTALSWVKDEYEKRGWTVYIVGEVATEVSMGNASPHEFKDKALGQAAMYFKQIADETFYETVARDNAEDGDRILIVCDRGAADAFGFLDREQQQRFLAKTGTTRRKIFARYDAVFHLVSAAIGAPEYYTVSNNSARREGLEEAAESDRRIVKAWTGHPHLRIIDNSNDFHDKMMRLLAEISVATGDPVPYEVERKFLIKRPDERTLAAWDAEPEEILQVYLTGGEGERRVRQRGADGVWSYTATMKRETGDPGVRLETEKRITEKEYLDLLLEADMSKRPIRKTRWCFPYKSKYFEIDVYPGEEDFAIMEVELSKTDEDFEMPEFIEIVEEVTENMAFRNRAIAERGYLMPN